LLNNWLPPLVGKTYSAISLINIFIRCIEVKTIRENLAIIFVVALVLIAIAIMIGIYLIWQVIVHVGDMVFE
jgi:phosphate/sulfate permease